MVSTDSETIADIAVKNSAGVPFMRSKKNSDNQATLAEVVAEVLHEYEHKGKIFDSFCCILPTAPFLTPEMLIEAWELLTNKEYSSVIPVQRFPYPIQRALKLSPSKNLRFMNEDLRSVRSQDLEDTFHDAGLFYWVKSANFKQEKTLLTKKSGALIIPSYKAHDIDNEEDWKNAELKFRMLQSD